MATSNMWCQNPKCVQRKTNAQIRGSKGNKYYQSTKHRTIFNTGVVIVVVKNGTI